MASTKLHALDWKYFYAHSETRIAIAEAHGARWALQHACNAVFRFESGVEARWIGSHWDAALQLDLQILGGWASLVLTTN